MTLQQVQEQCKELESQGFVWGTTTQHGWPKSKHNHPYYGYRRLNYLVYKDKPTLDNITHVFREQANGLYVQEALPVEEMPVCIP